MRTYARWLFGISALFNFAVGLGLLCFRQLVSASIGLDPISGTNHILLNFAGTMVLLFGYAYVRVALEPATYRVLIPFTAGGKLLAVASGWVPWLMGAIPAKLPTIMALDLVFAILFLDFLRRMCKRNALT